MDLCTQCADNDQNGHRRVLQLHYPIHLRNKMPTLSLNPNLHPGYRLLRPRGRGSFGEVWEAENARGDTVALKFMHCTRDQGAAQELRSIQVVKELAHAH